RVMAGDAGDRQCYRRRGQQHASEELRHDGQYFLRADVTWVFAKKRTLRAVVTAARSTVLLAVLTDREKRPGRDGPATTWTRRGRSCHDLARSQTLRERQGASMLLCARP